MSAACSRAQDGNIHVQFPNSSERTCILPFEITERSEVLKNLLLDTDAGGICQLPEKVAQAWLHSCALELYELATEAPDTLVSYALAADYFQDGDLMDNVLKILASRLFEFWDTVETAGPNTNLVKATDKEIQCHLAKHALWQCQVHQKQTLSMQVLDRLGLYVSIAMLKHSPHDYNFHIQNLPECLHEYAVHSEFPDIIANNSLSMDCDRYTLQAITAALRVLCSLESIKHLELLNSCTSVERNAEAEAVSDFYIYFLHVLSMDLYELTVHSKHDPCFAPRTCPLRTVLRTLARSGSIKKLSLNCVLQEKALAFTKVCDMALDLSQGLFHLTSLESLTLINTCSFEYVSHSGGVARAIFQLPNLTALHFDGGKPEAISICVAQAMHPYQAFVDDPDLTRSMQEVLPGLEKIPPIKQFQDFIFRKIGRCYVNLMQHLALRECNGDRRYIPLHFLRTDGYLTKGSSLQQFGQAVCRFTQLTELQLLHGDGLEVIQAHFEDFETVPCTVVVGPVLQHLTNLRTLHLSETGSEVPRSWPFSKSIQIQALNNLSKLAHLQDLSLSMNCGQLYYQDLINAGKHLSLPPLTSLHLNWIKYAPGSGNGRMIMELPSLTCLKKLVISGSWAHAMRQRCLQEQSILKLCSFPELNHVEVLMHVQGVITVHTQEKTRVPFELQGISSLRYLTCLKFVSSTGAESAGRVCSEIDACTALKKLCIHSVCTSVAPSMLDLGLCTSQFTSVGQLELEQTKPLQSKSTPLGKVSTQRCEESLQLQKLAFCVRSSALRSQQIVTSLTKVTDSLTELQLACDDHQSIWNLRAQSMFHPGMNRMPETGGIERVLDCVTECTKLRKLDISGIDCGSEGYTVRFLNSLSHLQDLEWLGVSWPLTHSEATQRHFAVQIVLDHGRVPLKRGRWTKHAPAMIQQLHLFPRLKHLKLSMTRYMQRVESLWELLDQRQTIRDISCGNKICMYFSESEARAIQRVLEVDPTRCRWLQHHVADLLRYYEKYGSSDEAMCMHAKAIA